MGKSTLSPKARKHGLLGVGTLLLLAVPNEAQQSQSRHGLLTASGSPSHPTPSIFRVAASTPDLFLLTLGLC